MKIRKFLRDWHRDLGYFTVGILVIYCISGIILNHRHDFNPDYRIIKSEYDVTIDQKDSYSKDEIVDILSDLEREVVYKKHYVTAKDLLRYLLKMVSLLLIREKKRPHYVISIKEG